MSETDAHSYEQAPVAGNGGSYQAEGKRGASSHGRCLDSNAE